MRLAPTVWMTAFLVLGLGGRVLTSAGSVPPEDPADAPIYLHASKAKVHGKGGTRYEKGRGRDNIGFWHSRNDWVSWEFELKEPGTYLVQVTLAFPGAPGNSYTLSVGGTELIGAVVQTGNWGKFVTVPLGVVELTELGRQMLSVKPAIQKGPLMNLQAVTLRPGRWEAGLVALWRFDEGNGAVTEDYMGGTKDAVQFARWAPGAFRSGLQLNGVSSCVVRQAALAPKLRDGMTVEAWVRVDRGGLTWRPIVNRHEFPLGFFFGFDGGGDLGLHLAVGGKWLSCTSKARLSPRRWTHVAATFDSVMGLAVYVDGRQTGTLEAEGELVPATEVDLVIGRHNRHQWALAGGIDDVRLYNRALTPAQIARHHAEGREELVPPRPIAILAVLPHTLRPKVHQRVTLDVELDAVWGNPFDADDIRVDVAVATPSRRTWRAPGFLYEPFTRRLDKGNEVVEPDGEARWQLRLSFDEPGTHHLRVTATDRTGTAMSKPLQIEVEPADVAGAVRRHPTDFRYFVTDRGESFFPLGANVCWAAARGTFDYDDWLSKYADQGCNLFRVWLSPHWPTLSTNTATSGFDGIDLANAWRLDHVVETAERVGLRVMLCIDSFNILRSIERSPGCMEEAPFVRANGGPVGKPMDYFTDPRSLRAYRNRLRYLVARYGCSPAVFCWEFWNEVDIVDEYHSETVARWHRDMALHLRSIDPWRRLIATSHANPKGDPAVDALAELDFVMTHRYGGDDFPKLMGDDRRGKAAAKDRPHFHGEFGIVGDGKQTSDTDPKGIHLHNALYASVGDENGGAPMTWWWDNYVEPRNLYAIFGAFARWIEPFDFAAQKPRRADARIAGETEGIEGGTLTLVKGAWDPSPVNKPLAVHIDRNGQMTCPVAPSELLLGLGFHKDKHNPVTFHLDVPKDTTFGVEVTKSSGFGNGHLTIHLDRKLALEKDFPVPEGNKKDTLTAGAGLYEIKLPKGRHTVVVNNTGKDWLSLGSYRIPWLKIRKRVVDPLRVNGLVGDTMALIWVHSRDHVWSRATKKGFKPVPIGGAQLQLAGLAPGPWTVEHWDTHKGEVTRTEPATVAPDGKLTLPLPEMAWDAALRLRKLPPR